MAQPHEEEETLTVSNSALSEVPAPARKKRRQLREEARQAIVYPVPPKPITSLRQPRGVVNHSYRDFSQVPAAIDHPAVPDFVAENLDQMNFALKLHYLMASPEFPGGIVWQPHGRAFCIAHAFFLEQSNAFLSIFGCRRYCVFLAVLNSYGFKHITQGTDRNCFYHELFLRGLPHLCYYLEEPRDARKLQPDPDHEPDFTHISQKYPLPPLDNSQ